MNHNVKKMKSPTELFNLPWFDKCEVLAGFNGYEDYQKASEIAPCYTYSLGYINKNIIYDFDRPFQVCKLQSSDFVSYEISPCFMRDQVCVRYSVCISNCNDKEIEVLKSAFDVAACNRRGAVFQVEMELSDLNVNLIRSIHDKIKKLIEDNFDYVEGYYLQGQSPFSMCEPLSSNDSSKIVARSKYIIGRAQYSSYCSHFSMDKNLAKNLLLNLQDVRFKYFFIKSAYLNFGEGVTADYFDEILLARECKDVYSLSLSLSDLNKSKIKNKEILNQFKNTIG